MLCPGCQSEIPTPPANMGQNCANGCDWAVVAGADGQLHLMQHQCRPPLPGTVCLAPETAEPVTCPNCSYPDRADVSPHVYFMQNLLALRCRACHHVWPAPLDTPTREKPPAIAPGFGRANASPCAEPDPEPQDEYLALTSLSVLDLQPGDVIVITDPQDRTRGERGLLAMAWAERFPEHEVIYLDGGKELGVLRRGEGGDGG